MRILVTGIAGFIGSNTAAALAKEGHEVSGVDCFDSYYSTTVKKANANRLWKEHKILTHNLDIATDPLSGILEGIDAVVHLAAQPGIDANTTYDAYIKNNFYATVALIQAMKEAPSKPFLVHGSTSSVYGINATGDEDTAPLPASAYGVTKLSSEVAIQAAHRTGEIRATIIRFFSVYGPSERPDKLIPRVFKALKHDTQFPLFEGSLEHIRCFSYVGDIANGISLALNNFDKAQGEIFNLGSDETHTTAEILEQAQQIVGKKLKIKTLPKRPGDQSKTEANIAKVQKILGYKPQTTLKEGLQNVWKWAQTDL